MFKNLIYMLHLPALVEGCILSPANYRKYKMSTKSPNYQTWLSHETKMQEQTNQDSEYTILS